MIDKKFTPKRTVCKVTLAIPEEWANKEVAVVGEFNDWNESATKLEKKGNAWKTELRLKPESTYKFKYLIDGERWENDDAADGYVANEFGTEDSLISIGH